MPGEARDDLVFSGRDGRYLPRPKSSTGWLQSAVKRVEVEKITLQANGGQQSQLAIDSLRSRTLATLNDSVPSAQVSSRVQVLVASRLRQAKTLRG
jgi:hypothetical protein